MADTQDNRILIYNKIPTANNAPADVVVGQATFHRLCAAGSHRQTTNHRRQQYADSGGREFGRRSAVCADLGQNRVLIFNSDSHCQRGRRRRGVSVSRTWFRQAENNSFTVTNATLDAANNPTGVSPVLCQSNGTDTANIATFPGRCAATLSFPRFVISDGKRLFVADGGNDRVLIFNTIPKTSGARADIILGQPDEFSDNTGRQSGRHRCFSDAHRRSPGTARICTSATGITAAWKSSRPAIQNVPLERHSQRGQPADLCARFGHDLRFRDGQRYCHRYHQRRRLHVHGQDQRHA